MALIGNGAQAEFQALALKAVCGIETVRLYDTDPSATKKVVANLATSGLGIVACSSAQQAVEGAQVVTTWYGRQAVPRRSSPTTWSGRVSTSTRLAATAPARPNCIATSCSVPMSSSNTRRRPVSKVRSSKCPPTFR